MAVSIISVIHRLPLMFYVGGGWYYISASDTLESFQTLSQKHLPIFFIPSSPTALKSSRDIPSRKPTVYARPSVRTKRYCSTVSYGLL